MKCNLSQESTVVFEVSKFKYLPYIVELLMIMTGVLITTTSIIGSGILISAISEPSIAQISPQSLPNSISQSANSQ
jgi:hypothetical protein